MRGHVGGSVRGHVGGSGPFRSSCAALPVVLTNVALLNSIMGIISPILWSQLFAFFTSRPKASLIYLIFGPGGHLVVAGLSRFIACYTCSRIKDEHLFIRDTDVPDDIRPRLTPGKVLPAGETK